MAHSLKTLAVIGAGPKGIAVAVKAKVLKEMGLPVDDVILIEKHSVGAHWSGDAGYTDGEMRLGTSPEKDVVFPLESATGDPLLDRKIKQRLLHFTWVSYLVEQGTYSDWVDRGKPAPKHLEWSAYLKWVAAQLSPEVQILNAQVVCIDIQEEKWLLKLKMESDSERMQTLEVERLMLTGPGKTRLHQEGGEALPHTYDLETFWEKLKSGQFPTTGKVAVIGAGENAASVLIALSKLKTKLAIEVISPKGFIATRAENYYENQFYSKPLKQGWKELELKDRKDFIKRTDLGVFSVQAMQILSGEENHRIISGRVIAIAMAHGKLSLTLQYGEECKERQYDHVIFATGFDLVASIVSIFTTGALKKLEGEIGSLLSNEELSLRIDADLSLKGLIPTLHLPMLAGLQEGPGFSNLSCLGLLSDRVMINPMKQSLVKTLELLEA